MERNPIEVIQEHLDNEEMLCQLAEEASELAQAALKLRRSYNDTNPTPKSRKECYEALLEEIADVSVCLMALGYDRSLSRMRTSAIANEKLERWANRLEGKA